MDHLEQMIKKEQKYSAKKSPSILERHNQITEEMRAILFDWMMEVCYEMGFLRMTFHLSVEILDRFLANTTNFRRDRLQLAGVAAIAIASKKEESDPPRLDELARFTAGSCQVQDVKDQELQMLKILRWNLSPILPPEWLSLYLQCLFSNPSISSVPSGYPSSALPGHVDTDASMDRKYPRETFVNIMQLIDLCILDVESQRFPPGLLTAAALYHFSCQKVALDVSGYSRNQLNTCVRWMTRFAEALAADGLKAMKRMSGKFENECHNFQPWEKPLETLKRARHLRQRVPRRITSANDSMELDTPSPPSTPDMM